MAAKQRLKDKKRSAIFLILLTVLSACMINLLLENRLSFRASAVEATATLGVYWDANCTLVAKSIDWGAFTLGQEKKISMYVRNEGNETCFLSGKIVNWQGDNISTCMTLSCERPRIRPGKTAQINPKMYIFPNASGMTTFSFDMLIEAVPTEFGPRLSDMNGLVLKAAEDQVCFIYADPLRMTRAVATYDVASGSLVYGLCLNEQNQGFDTSPSWVSQLASDKGRLLFSNRTVLMFGGWAPHWCVNYLQAHRLTPVSSNVSAVGGQTHYRFVDTNTNTVLVDVTQSIDFEHEDYFVFMALKDANNNTIFVFYGFDWKGTWSAGISFKAICSTILTFTDQYYVIHWIDSNADGTPQPEEMIQVTSG